MAHKITSNHSAIVDSDLYWIPVDKNTQTGVKMLVIDDKQRIAYLREFWHGHGWTHWHPLPRFEDTQEKS